MRGNGSLPLVNELPAADVDDSMVAVAAGVDDVLDSMVVAEVEDVMGKGTDGAA